MSASVGMTKECVPAVVRTVETLAAVSSVSLNALLVYVVLRCNTNDLRAYSKLILCNCAADTLFTVASYVSEIVPTFPSF